MISLIKQSSTLRLHGYIPQACVFELYKSMFQNPMFVANYGVQHSNEKINSIIENQCNQWDQDSFGPYAWFDKTTNKFVGIGGLQHTTVEGDPAIELLYSLLPEFWVKGLATEISQSAINQAFQELKLDKIVCFTLPSNQRSLNVINKLDFTFVKDFVHNGLQHKLFELTR